jgi:hypothetical protein
LNGEDGDKEILYVYNDEFDAESTDNMETSKVLDYIICTLDVTREQLFTYIMDDMTMCQHSIRKWLDKNTEIELSTEEINKLRKRDIIYINYNKKITQTQFSRNKRKNKKLILCRSKALFNF